MAAGLATACASVGPKTISRDQFDYSTAIGRATNQQLLLNMVRVRVPSKRTFAFPVGAARGELRPAAAALFCILLHVQ